MARYFLIEGGVITQGPVQLPTAWRNVSGLHLAVASVLKSHGWLPEVKVGDDASFNPATHKLTGPVFSIGTDAVTSTWTVVQMSAQEQQDYQDNQDQSAILSGVLDLAQITITLIDTMLAQGIIVATDFDVATRQLYQSLKARVDRLR